MHMFEQALIKQLCNAIVLQHVVGGKVMFSALLLEKFGKIPARVFPTVVRLKSFDVCSMLSSCPGCISSISLQSLILRVQRSQLSVTRVVISKGNIILASSNHE